MKTTCVVQARTGSTRLPGKVLAPIAGMPMLELMLRRLEPLEVDALVVATTAYERDDPIEAIAARLGVPVVRGTEHDVLARFGLALDQHPARTVVRLTADCPLTDPGLVAAVLARHHDTGAEYTSNVLPRSFPKGLDVEVVSAEALRAAIDEARDPAEREHVTPFVYRRPERFPLANVRSGLRLADERWTVDTADDLEWVRHAVERVGSLYASWAEILTAVGREDHPVRSGAVALRPAETADAGRVLAWRNDADAVRFSASGRAVDSVDHARWFARVVDDPAHRLWIGEIDTVPVGMVRADVASGIGTVSIVVDPAHRGRGIGPALLHALDEATFADCQIIELVAHVRPTNGASLRAFAAAGYRSLGTGRDGLVRLAHRPGVPMEAA
jgi:spore coat polysaccharide biosynthesis protein SpsF